MSNAEALPDWERVLASASRLQSILPEATLVGGTASAVYAGHRVSRDADHVLDDLRSHFDQVLGQLESVAGWRTARIKRPVLILGSLDGIETGVRQLIRQRPLEVTEVEVRGSRITLPTQAEMLRVKAILILRRNATRDYLYFAAMYAVQGEDAALAALRPFDDLYPQDSGESALQQLQVQLGHPLPFDLDEVNLAEYRQLDPCWHDWRAVEGVCQDASVAIFEGLICRPEADRRG